jgi:hypothetical protein
MRSTRSCGTSLSEEAPHHTESHDSSKSIAILLKCPGLDLGVTPVRRVLVPTERNEQTSPCQSVCTGDDVDYHPTLTAPFVQDLAGLGKFKDPTVIMKGFRNPKHLVLHRHSCPPRRLERAPTGPLSQLSHGLELATATVSRGPVMVNKFHESWSDDARFVEMRAVWNDKIGTEAMPLKIEFANSLDARVDEHKRLVKSRVVQSRSWPSEVLRPRGVRLRGHPWRP